MHAVTEPIAFHFDGDGYALVIASTDTAEAYDRAGLVQCVELAPGVSVDTTPAGEVLSLWIQSRPYDDAEARDNGDTVSLRLHYPSQGETSEEAGGVTLYRCTSTGSISSVAVLRPCR